MHIYPYDSAIYANNTNKKFQNSTYLQKKIKNLYLDHCRKKMTKEKLDKFLKRDLMFNFKKSRKLGLVDELI